MSKTWLEFVEVRRWTNSVPIASLQQVKSDGDQNHICLGDLVGCGSKLTVQRLHYDYDTVSFACRLLTTPIVLKLERVCSLLKTWCLVDHQFRLPLNFGKTDSAQNQMIVDWLLAYLLYSLTVTRTTCVGVGVKTARSRESKGDCACMVTVMPKCDCERTHSPNCFQSPPLLPSPPS